MTKNYTIRTKYFSQTGPLEKARYGNGSLALVVGDRRTPSHVVVSVNLEDYGLVPPAGCVYVPDYSEHEGLPEALAEAGIAAPIETVTFGNFNTVAMLMRVIA